MKIIFVRHGHPDYKNDCLTDLGNAHAQAVGNRLKDQHIDRIFSSTCGRAYQTACYIAPHHGLEVQGLKFMREISWGKPNTDDYMHPWNMAARWVKDGKDVMKADWRDDEDIKGHTLLTSYETVACAFDEWLTQFGLVREGCCYRVVEENTETIVLTSHGGSSSVVLSHIFNLPFPFICHAICPDFTAVTVVNFEGEKGSLTSPSFELVNDNRHIKDISAEIYYGN